MLKRGENASGGGVSSITGYAAKTRSFTATIGHKYLVAFDSLTKSSGITNPIDGLDIIDNTGPMDSAAESNYYSRLQVVIGVATKTTVTCSWRNGGTGTYSNIAWVDLG